MSTTQSLGGRSLSWKNTYTDCLRGAFIAPFISLVWLQGCAKAEELVSHLAQALNFLNRRGSLVNGRIAARW